MLLTAAISTIQFKLGRRRDLDDVIRARLDAQQEELEREANLPWFLVERRDLVVAGSPVDMPEGFIREYEDGDVYIQLPTVGTEPRYGQLAKFSPKNAQRHVVGEGGPGMPCVYSFLGERLQLWPTPDKEYTLAIDGYWKDVLPSTAFAEAGNAATNKWLTHAPLVLVEKVVVDLCLDMRDDKGAKAATARLSDALVKMQEQNLYRREYNQLRTMGEDN